MLKVAVTGPESTGKSWLASKLAVYYSGLWVPEFARTYLLNLGRKYTLDDVEYIAGRQNQFIRNAMSKDAPVMFADTEMVVCKIWSEFVFGYCPESISALLDAQKFDIYLLCDIDLPWEPDPLREHPDKREELRALYLKELNERGFRYTLIQGTGKLRLQNAIAQVNKALGVKD